MNHAALAPPPDRRRRNLAFRNGRYLHWFAVSGWQMVIRLPCFPGNPLAGGACHALRRPPNRWFKTSSTAYCNPCTTSRVPEIIAEVQKRCLELQLTPPSVSTLRRRLRVHLPGSGPATAEEPPGQSNGSGALAIRPNRSPPVTDTDAHLLSVLYETVGNVNGWAPFLEALTATYPGGQRRDCHP